MAMPAAAAPPVARDPGSAPFLQFTEPQLHAALAEAAAAARGLRAVVAMLSGCRGEVPMSTRDMAALLEPLYWQLDDAVGGL